MKNVLIMNWVIYISINSLQAQINLEHTFNSNSNHVQWFYQSSQIMYYYTDGNNLYFYNEDYSLYKSLTIPNPNGYSFAGIRIPSDFLFNNNSLIEFICLFSKSNPSEVQSKLYDENGNILQTFNNSLPMGVNYGVHNTTNSGYRLTMQRFSAYPSTYVYDIYSLPGTLTSIETNAEITIYENPFPNPSKDFIYLPYSINKEEISEMKIYSIEGQLMETRKIEGFSNEILINTISYPSGIYIYRYQDKSGSFVVQ